MFGRIKFYTLGFAVFTVGSALCSLSQTGDQLVFFRIVQAVGAAFIQANSLAIVTDAFPVNERGRAIGINQITGFAGSVGGLVLGGVLTSLAGWPAIFWVNIPVGIVAILYAHFRLHEISAIQRGQRMDILGNVTLAGGLVAILTGISLYAIGELSFAQFSGLMIGGIALIVVFAYIETKAKFPMFNLSLFRIRAYTAGNLGSFLVSTARGAVTFIMSLYLQGPTMGLSPILAGIYLIPNTLALAVMGPISGILSDKYGARGLSTLGIFISVVGYYMLSTIGPVESFVNLAIPLVLIGVGFGTYVTPNRTSLIAPVPPKYRGVALGVNLTLVNAGNVLAQGIAFLVMSFSIPVANIQSLITTHGFQQGASDVGFITAIHWVGTGRLSGRLGADHRAPLCGGGRTPAPAGSSTTGNSL